MSDDIEFDFDDEYGHHDDLAFAFFVKHVSEAVLPTLMDLYVAAASSGNGFVNKKMKDRIVQDGLSVIEDLSRGLADMVAPESDE